MLRLSTLLYAPVVFTVLAACAPRRAERVAARVAAATPRPRVVAADPGVNQKLTDGALATAIDATKRVLREQYFMDLDPDPRKRLTSAWDPNDKQGPMRREIEGHLKTLVSLYGRRLALSGPTPESMLGYHRAEFVLREFEREDARQAGK